MSLTRIKRTAFVVVLLSLIIGLEFAYASEAQDIREIPECEYCGMHRQSYAHSRMLIVYEDGTVFGACSIHCAALNLVVQIDKELKTLWVADYYSKELVDAETAWWVMGGARAGVMTKRAKWAFGVRKDATRFIAENGGDLASFDTVMQTTYEDMVTDTKMIRMKKKIGKMNPF
jgi:copper chaperone NosL